jgi:hypothetical protein
MVFQKVFQGEEEGIQGAKQESNRKIETQTGERCRKNEILYFVRTNNN